MKTILCFFPLLFSSLLQINAQSIEGTYFIAASGGEILLTLQQLNASRVTGTMVDVQGTRYHVEGVLEEGDVSGTISNPQAGSLFFEAFREDQELYLTLFPVNANQQPDYNQAQEFVLTQRDDGSQPAIPSASQPMSGPLGGPMSTQTQKANWSGNYQGNINGTPSQLTINQNGQQVSGQINASGYLYNLSGDANGNTLQGTVTDVQSGGQMTCQGSISGNRIDLNLSFQGNALNLSFTRVGSGSINIQPESQGQNPGQSNLSQLDQRIVGSWLYTDSYSSGEYSFATQYRLIINGDGSYLYGDGKVAGGGAGVSGSSGSSGMTPGKWKTDGNMIYIDEGYGFQPYARYYVEGASLMLTFGDGSRQVWKRSY